MHPLFRSLLLAILPLLAVTAVAADPAPATPPAATPAAPLATTVPDDRNYRSKVDFQTSWEDYLATRKGQPCDVIFIGDSITQQWRWGAGKPVWQKHFAARALDFGQGGDTTQNVIWRLKNLDVKSFKPKVAVLLIGTNNTRNTAEDIAAGVKAVIATTQETFPGAKVVLVSILPNARANELMASVNTLIRTFADDQSVHYLDLAAKFPVEGDNWKGLSRDRLHLSTAGYETWAAELLPVLEKLAPSSGPAATTSAPAPAASSPQAAGKTFIDYFLPMPIVGSLVSNVWGAPGVFPRDPKNGLEDETMQKWCYWDGQIIKGPDGKYHMFASRWDQALGHNGWGSSLAVHAVADQPIGPYTDKGVCWPESMEGRGHNVTALVLPNDEGYAVIVSETRPGAVFVSKSLEGPWTMKGLLTVEGQPDWRASNVSVMLRPDGDYMIVPRNGRVMISKASDGICGPYKVVGPAFPRGIPNLEDPVVWFSGGIYHIVVNSWSTRVAYHLTSKDGKTNWVNRGLAYDPRTKFLRYTDGTVNHWDKLERPGVVLENGHVKYFSLSVLDVEKRDERGNDMHGSKVIVIPFDGEALDRDMAKIIAAEDAAAGATATAEPK